MSYSPVKFIHISDALRQCGTAVAKLRRFELPGMGLYVLETDLRALAAELGVALEPAA